MAFFEGVKMTAGYGNGPDIISSCNINVNRGEIVAILGPNGAGKSTAMKAMLGLLTLKSGSVCLDGEDISKISPQDRVKKGISFVPQTRNVFAELTVRENLENNVLEQLVSTLISEKLLEMEIKDLNLKISEKSLAKNIRKNPNFFDENNKFFCFQGRSFGNEKPKYITLKLSPDKSKVYGLNRVDKSKHILVVEGPIDSLFLDNCIAVAGSTNFA